MDNIILVGMPGCGKSTLGVVLARKLGYGYLDTDSFISQREKKHASRHNRSARAKLLSRYREQRRKRDSLRQGYNSHGRFNDNVRKGYG